MSDLVGIAKLFSLHDQVISNHENSNEYAAPEGIPVPSRNHYISCLGSVANFVGFECGRRPDIIMLRAPQTAEMQ